VVRDTMKWTFCVCCVLVRGQIVLYLVLQSVPVEALAVKSNYFYPCSTFRHLVYKKLSKNTRGRLDVVIIKAAADFQTLLHVYKTTRRHISGAFNVMLHTCVV
jgi:predicted Zn-dependent protease